MTAHTTSWRTHGRDDPGAPDKTAQDHAGLAEPGKTVDRAAHDQPDKTRGRDVGASGKADGDVHEPALDNTIALLRRTPIFAVLPLEALAPLAVEAQPQTYKRGDYLWAGGDAHTAVYLIVAGQAQVLCVTPDGRAGALDLLGAGDLFGLASLEREPPDESMAGCWTPARAPSACRAGTSCACWNAIPPLRIRRCSRPSGAPRACASALRT